MPKLPLLSKWDWNAKISGLSLLLSLVDHLTFYAIKLSRLIIRDKAGYSAEVGGSTTVPTVSNGSLGSTTSWGRSKNQAPTYVVFQSLKVRLWGDKRASTFGEKNQWWAFNRSDQLTLLLSSLPTVPTRAIPKMATLLLLPKMWCRWNLE